MTIKKIRKYIIKFRQSNIAKKISNTSTKIMVSLVLSGAFLLLIYLFVSLIYLTPSYIENMDSIITVDIEELTLEEDEFYFRDFSTNEITLIEYEIDNLPSKAEISILVADDHDVRLYDNGSYDIEDYEYRDILARPTYWKDEFIIPSEGNWLILILNEYYFTATFSIKIRIISQTQYNWWDAFRHIDILANTTLAPILIIGGFIGLAFTLLNVLDKLYLEENEDTKIGYSRKKFGIWKE